jgi:MoaA/NifB/PqqE/SkfB family radical SAM enzyme
MNRVNPFTEVYQQMDYDDLQSPYPHTVDIELTNKCNFQCCFCCRQLMTRRRGSMNDATFHRILDEITPNRIPVRFIRWGEPFLHPRILEYAQLVKHQGIPLHITTNGSLLDDGKMQALIDMRLDSLIFSMQGTGREEYTKQRIGGSYDQLARTIKRMVNLRGEQEKPFITVTTTVEKGASKKEVEWFREYWGHVVDAVRVGRTVLTWFDDKILSDLDHPVCYEPFRQLSFNWDGDVTACCGDYNGLLVVGNIHQNSLSELWSNNKRLDAIRTLISSGCYSYLTLCSKCDFGSITE